ncbi:hypothetical protein BV25DRAFT_1839261 [Artomyces pyxidatus]|uniref:Uncharacterized protein n=1 Tax=Artomyces pyxidatus TaxID=48021 RepID=A0ACB8SXE4_9AGAM|nr:hypothetical protein BV25DRAFT_1839261 [Artomyces pyxidatus]
MKDETLRLEASDRGEHLVEIHTGDLTVSLSNEAHLVPSSETEGVSFGLKERASLDDASVGRHIRPRDKVVYFMCADGGEFLFISLAPFISEWGTLSFFPCRRIAGESIDNSHDCLEVWNSGARVVQSNGGVKVGRDGREDSLGEGFEGGTSGANTITSGA